MKTCAPHVDAWCNNLNSILSFLGLQWNLIVFNTLQTWFDIMKHISRKRFSAILPLIYNLALAPGQGTSVPESRHLKGIKIIRDQCESQDLVII